MMSDLRLRRAPAGCFARVLAGIMRNKIRTAASPTAAECVPHTESVYQVFRTIDSAAAAASVCGGRR